MTRGVRDQRSVVRSRLIVRSVLRRARRKGWDDVRISEVMVASLVPMRVKLGVVGPCFYCGDDLASTVDHIVPVSAGGTDDPWNVVSACFACNLLKRDIPPDRFAEAYPYGSDLRRNAAHFQSRWEIPWFAAWWQARIDAADALEAERRAERQARGEPEPCGGAWQVPCLDEQAA